MHFYNDWAQRILHGDLTNHLAFYGLPLYAYLLALIYKVFGYGPFVPAFLQAICEAGTATLIYLLATLVLPRPETKIATSIPRAGFIATHSREIVCLLAGLGWAFFVPAEAYSIILMPTAWVVFVFWLVVWLIVKNRNAPSLGTCLWLGLLIGFTAMGIATILFLLPMMLAALFVKPNDAGAEQTARRKKSRLAAAMVLLLSGVALGASPCWIHNYFVAHDSVPLSAHSGINFWIGNNPDANGYPRFPPGLRAGQAAMLQDSITAAESAAGHALKLSEVSRYWSAQASNFIAGHFGDWLLLLGKKLRNFGSAFQYDDLSIITMLREHGVVFPGLYFGLVAALALPGIFFAWRVSAAARWIALAIGLQIIALMPVFVTERYRLPVVPGLLVFAAVGLWSLWNALATSEYRTVIVYFFLLVGATALVSWPQRNPSLWALDAYNAGWQALESNNLSVAERKLAIARAYVPTNTETNFALGNLRLAQGNSSAAARFYRETLTIDRNHKGALNNLGVIALDGRDIPAAQMYFERSLTVDPRNAKTYYLLARASLAAGAPGQAKLQVRKAIELGGSLAEFRELQTEIEKRTTAPVSP